VGRGALIFPIPGSFEKFDRLKIMPPPSEDLRASLARSLGAQVYKMYAPISGCLEVKPTVECHDGGAAHSSSLNTTRSAHSADGGVCDGWGCALAAAGCCFGCAGCAYLGRGTGGLGSLSGRDEHDGGWIGWASESKRHHERMKSVALKAAEALCRDKNRVANGSLSLSLGQDQHRGPTPLKQLKLLLYHASDATFTWRG